ncbi:type I polyketide synthase [Kordia jejudonensis]|uniref:type I polyketide synthase n=1 Tax=Kordia jejudonensis TaxID=1348245 RepID=UPI000629008F|nr:type I polyketide synthase [Kordia jejudonensis]
MNGLEIAVIGVSCRFPKSTNLSTYWKNLIDGKELISFFSDEELRNLGIDESRIQDAKFVKASGVLNDVDCFDANFFDYTPKEALRMHPSTRIFHECVWHVLEDAGYDPFTYKGLIGMYAGSSQSIDWNFDAFQNATSDTEKYQTYIHSPQFMASRLAYKMNLKGPVSLLNTACSTSLVAIQEACKSLLIGECDMAIAGAVSVHKSIAPGYEYQEGMIMSVDGHCKAFDETATGTVPGDGAGTVLLKRYEEAVEDGDRIYAVIKGGAVNNDGNRKVGYTAPSIEGQIQVIQSAIQVSEIEPESVSFIETHGTGTNIGDPIEIEALKTIYGMSNRTECYLGASKTNLGHLDVAAGMAGFIKTVMALHHKSIPPTLHFQTPNKKIQFEKTPFQINTKAIDWTSQETPLRAGISAFGIGGTNAHIILEEAPKQEKPTNTEEAYAIQLSAKSLESLQTIKQELSTYITTHPDVALGAIAYTLNKRASLPIRESYRCKTIEELQNHLQKVVTASIPSQKKKLVFMFSGQGSQFLHMGKNLYENNAFFKQQLDACLQTLQNYTGIDYKEILYPENPENATSQINETVYTQPLLFSFEYALTQYLLHVGLQPDYMIGHSLGEYVAASISGVLKRDDALKLIVDRAKLMQSMEAGTMISVMLSAAEAEQYTNDHVSIAVINTHKSCVLSGTHEAIQKLQTVFKEKGIISIPLKTSHAFHSHMMENMLDAYLLKLKTVSKGNIQIPYIANTTGEFITQKMIADPAYWTNHLRNTVHFAKGIDTLKEEGTTLFLEIGPGNTLTSIVKSHLGRNYKDIAWNTTKKATETINDNELLLQRMGMLWEKDFIATIPWQTPNETRSVITLPAYPFAKTKFEKKTQTYRTTTKELRYYTPTWIRRKLPISSEEHESDTTWLLFTDKTLLSKALLENEFFQNKKVRIVQRAETYKQLSDTELRIDPTDESHYQLIFDQVNTKSLEIVYAWNLETVDDIPINDQMYASFYNLHRLVKASQSIHKATQIHIRLITDSLYTILGNDSTNALQSIIQGMLMAIHKEFEHISTSTIDIQLTTKIIDESTAAELVKEFKSNQKKTATAYRNGHRWIQSYEEYDVSNTKITTAKNGNTYIITGGLGAIGLAVALHIAKQATANIILINRSTKGIDSNESWTAQYENASTEETKQLLQQLIAIEALGATTELVIADITEKESIATAFATIKQTYNNINGIFHAAGIADYGGFLLHRTEESIQQVLAPKIEGTLHIAEAVKDEKLDFFILFSSLASVFGAYGQAAYVAANNFLDTFAKNTNYLPNCKLVTSVNWTTWKHMGMAAPKKRTNQSIDEISITKEQGVTALQTILSLQESQIIVLDRTLKQLQEESKNFFQHRLHKNENTVKTEQLTRTALGLDGTFIAPEGKLELQLAKLVAAQVGISEIGVQDNFFELGLTSLDITELNGKVKEITDEIITITDFFNHPTIRELATHIAGNIPEEEIVEQEDSLDILNRSLSFFNLNNEQENE